MAITTYDAALALQPDDPTALNNKGNALRKLGRYEAAIAAYDAALALQPDDPSALNNKGRTLWKAKRLREAIEVFQQIDDWEELFKSSLSSLESKRNLNWPDRIRRFVLRCSLSILDSSHSA
ncbi:MAG: tetratricopeptide repeat protein [Cyanobacteria bacterium P01_F01_bin.86]